MSVAQPFGDPPEPFVPRHHSYCWRCGHPPGLHGAERGACRAGNCRGCLGFLAAAEDAEPRFQRPAERLPTVPPRGRVARSVPRPRRRRRRTPSQPLAVRLTPTRHTAEVHNPLRFGVGSHGAASECSYFRYCGRRAAVDSHDACGRRRALCFLHWLLSPVFGPLGWADQHGSSEPEVEA